MDKGEIGACIALIGLMICVIIRVSFPQFFQLVYATDGVFDPSTAINSTISYLTYFAFIAGIITVVCIAVYEVAKYLANR